MIPLGQDVAAGITLTLDGQSGSNTYSIYTSGSQFTQNNYTVNVLGTHAPTDGTDALNVYGYDTYTGNTPSSTGVNPSTGQNYATNDVFLLRSVPYIIGETATQPALYQGTGDCSAPDRRRCPIAPRTTARVERVRRAAARDRPQAEAADSQGYLINNGETGIFGVEQVNYDS